MIAVQSPSPTAATIGLTSDPQRVRAFVRTIPRRAASGLSFFGWLYLSTAVFMGAWVFGTSALLGWKPVLVTTNSMSPAIRAGDVMMVGARPPGALGQRTVIQFDDPAAPGKTLTHRIVIANADGTYQTQGDSNSDADTAPVAPEQIKGVGRMVIPAIGKPAVWLADGRAGLITLWAFLSVIAALFAFWRPDRHSRRPRRAKSKAAA